MQKEEKDNRMVRKTGWWDDTEVMQLGVMAAEEANTKGADVCGTSGGWCFCWCVFEFMEGTAPLSGVVWGGVEGRVH